MTSARYKFFKSLRFLENLKIDLNLKTESISFRSALFLFVILSSIIPDVPAFAGPTFEEQQASVDRLHKGKPSLLSKAEQRRMDQLKNNGARTLAEKKEYQKLLDKNQSTPGDSTPKPRSVSGRQGGTTENSFGTRTPTPQDYKGDPSTAPRTPTRSNVKQNTPVSADALNNALLKSKPFLKSQLLQENLSPEDIIRRSENPNDAKYTADTNAKAELSGRSPKEISNLKVQRAMKKQFAGVKSSYAQSDKNKQRQENGDISRQNNRRLESIENDQKEADAKNSDKIKQPTEDKTIKPQVTQATASVKPPEEQLTKTSNTTAPLSDSSLQGQLTKIKTLETQSPGALNAKNEIAGTPTIKARTESLNKAKNRDFTTKLPSSKLTISDSTKQNLATINETKSTQATANSKVENPDIIEAQTNKVNALKNSENAIAKRNERTDKKSNAGITDESFEGSRNMMERSEKEVSNRKAFEEKFPQNNSKMSSSNPTRRASLNDLSGKSNETSPDPTRRASLNDLSGKRNTTEPLRQTNLPLSNTQQLSAENLTKPEETAPSAKNINAPLPPPQKLPAPPQDDLSSLMNRVEGMETKSPPIKTTSAPTEEPIISNSQAIRDNRVANVKNGVSDMATGAGRSISNAAKTVGNVATAPFRKAASLTEIGSAAAKQRVDDAKSWWKGDKAALKSTNDLIKSNNEQIKKLEAKKSLDGNTDPEQKNINQKIDTLKQDNQVREAKVADLKTNIQSTNKTKVDAHQTKIDTIQKDQLEPLKAQKQAVADKRAKLNEIYKTKEEKNSPDYKRRNADMDREEKAINLKTKNVENKITAENKRIEKIDPSAVRRSSTLSEPEKFNTSQNSSSSMNAKSPTAYSGKKYDTVQAQSPTTNQPVSSERQKYLDSVPKISDGSDANRVRSSLTANVKSPLEQTLLQHEQASRVPINDSRIDFGSPQSNSASNSNLSALENRGPTPPIPMPNSPNTKLTNTERFTKDLESTPNLKGPQNATTPSRLKGLDLATSENQIKETDSFLNKVDPKYKSLSTPTVSSFDAESKALSSSMPNLAASKVTASNSSNLGQSEATVLQPERVPLNEAISTEPQTKPLSTELPPPSVSKIPNSPPPPPKPFEEFPESGPPPPTRPLSNNKSLPTDLKTSLNTDNPMGRLKKVGETDKNTYAKGLGLEGGGNTIKNSEFDNGIKTGSPGLRTAEEMSANAQTKESNHNYQNHLTGNDRCRVSVNINSDYSCAGTESALQNTQMGMQMAQMTGSLATQGMGAAAQVKAMGSDNQQTQLKSAAELQIAAGGSQTLMGMGVIAAGAYMNRLGNNHNKYSKSLEDSNNGAINAPEVNGVQLVTRQSGTSDSDNIINKMGLEGTTLEYAKGQRRQIASAAIAEQKGVAKEAKMMGFMTMMQGFQQAAAGAVNTGAGYMAYKNAEAYTSGTNTPPPNLVMPPNDMNSNSGNPTGGGGGGIITGDGLNSNAAPVTATDTTTAATPPSLGTGFDPNPSPSNLGPGDGAGQFNLGAPQSGSGGGGGGFAGGGETYEAQGAQDPGAMVAQNPDGQAYATGGAFSGGGGGGKGGGGSNDGPDLSGLLAAFLPKKEDAAKTPGIMEFGSQGPGSQNGGPASMFDKNVNIFERVHDTYQDKNKHGAL